jgi:hypothetical protein
MFYWIYDISTAALAALFSGFFVGFSCLGAILVRPYLRWFIRNEPQINDLIGYILSCYGVFYGLLVGLIAVAAYQNYADTESTVNQEAAAVTALFRDVTCYPEPERTELMALLREYTRYQIEDAWPLQRRGIIPEGGAERLGAFLSKLTSFEPRSKGQELLHAEALSAFNELSKLRRLRLFSVTTGIPPLMWYVVIIGAFMTIVLVWLFDMELKSHLFLGGLLSFFIGTVICLIAAMDNPYRGEVSIGPDAFQNVFDQLMDSKRAPTASPARIDRTSPSTVR